MVDVMAQAIHVFNGKAQVARTVVISGGGTGIGKAIAKAFASDGESVVILGRRKDVLQSAATELGDAVIPRQCDVSDPAQVEALVEWLRTEVSPTVDVLVNNAGGTGSLDETATLEEAAAYAVEMLSANLVSAYLMVNALRPCLRRPGGRVINISSIAAFRGGRRHVLSSKGGTCWPDLFTRSGLRTRRRDSQRNSPRHDLGHGVFRRPHDG